MSNLNFPDTCGVTLSSYGALLATFLCKSLEMMPDDIKTVSQFEAASSYHKALHPEYGPEDDDVSDED
jgi:hypothetical protein